MKYRVVLDTNVLVSAVVFPGGVPEDVWKTVQSGEVEFGVSEAILDELYRVLGSKFHFNETALALQKYLILQNAKLIDPDIIIDSVVRDVNDKKILECAVEFKAHFIVTGDNHLLELKKFKGIMIVRPAVFLEILAGQTGGGIVREPISKYINKSAKKKNFR
ncbi:MAG: putative toxin-antitoxin system toxin component, PIN family [Candidatus Firestonebacteria bacterium]